MEKRDFLKLENMCQFRFMKIGTCFHVCSQENHPVLFHNEEEFKTAMNIVAFCAFLFPNLSIFTFEVMDNHFHFAISGSSEEIEMFVKTLIKRLAAHPLLSPSSKDIKKLSFKTYPVGGLDNLRNIIAYINRNGSVVNQNESVFTYRWGANRYFFNCEARMRFESCGIVPSYREKRLLFRSNLLANENRIILLDGYVSPLCFCHIRDVELCFRSNRHYFFSIARNIEASMDIAKYIGERMFYSDEDLFAHIKSVCANKYGSNSVSTINKEAKIELAKELHFDYNAGNKQISRLLKIDLPIISSLFPE